MKQSTKMIALLSILSLSMGTTLPTSAQTRVIPPVTTEELNREKEPEIDSTLFRVRELDELLSELDKNYVQPPVVNRLAGPWIFSTFRHIKPNKKLEIDYTTVYKGMKVATNDSVSDNLAGYLEIDEIAATDSPETEEDILLVEEEAPAPPELAILKGDPIPEKLRTAINQMRMQDDLMYATMIYHPASIDYAYWDLPVPPTLPDDEVTFEAYLRKLDLPQIEAEKAILPDEVVNKIHWLHNVNASAQFSQAYVSSNWYQGGNDHIALLLGANWNVQLNQVYHPNLLFQSNLSYKLGLNSTPQDQVHKYSISEDIFQWNLNTGLKALKKWYYSFNAQFKTQIFKNYQTNSHNLKASFLSPGDFNMGLGMSYSNKKPNLEFTATISPFSYNLKTCISDKIDHGQFNIAADKHTHSEFGSNAEFNMNWKVRYNVGYKTRLFLFSDYTYFLADWEHTFNFEINRFLSTQIYVHMRYDTSTETLTKWKHFMLREVLSFGLSYTFSTKQ
ncbi:MAG: DUF3078 domain-containing protein [Muribaculaceae bacterium]|nr:DUF3078 domain-containing protein [Muribaculaceae bacterium]MDE6769682.1 DUF3078 domain-containing protein [Muribaculaceae bacterium]